LKQLEILFTRGYLSVVSCDVNCKKRDIIFQGPDLNIAETIY